MGRWGRLGEKMKGYKFWIKIAILILVITQVQMQGFAQEVKRITPRMIGDFYHAAASPDGKWVAFASTFKEVGKQRGCFIWLADAQAFKLDNLKAVTVMSCGQAPAWSPDSRWIAFQSYEPKGKSGCYDIWKIKIDGTGLRKLTNSSDYSEECQYPAWSPDGKNIAFSKESNLWIMNADGSGERRLTPLRTEGYECGANWSPDGKWILFSAKKSDVKADYDIWIVAADGAGAKKLVDMESWELSPIWTLDGKKILFVKGKQIWKMSPDGTGLQKILNLESEKDIQRISQISLGRKGDLWITVEERPVPQPEDFCCQSFIWRAILPASVFK